SEGEKESEQKGKGGGFKRLSPLNIIQLADIGDEAQKKQSRHNSRQETEHLPGRRVQLLVLEYPLHRERRCQCGKAPQDKRPRENTRQTRTPTAIGGH